MVGKALLRSLRQISPIRLIGGYLVSFLSLFPHLVFWACVLELFDDLHSIALWMAFGTFAFTSGLKIWISLESSALLFRALQIPEFFALLGGVFALFGILNLTASSSVAGIQLVVLYPSLAFAWFARRSEAFEEACDWVERRMRGRVV